MENNGIIFIDKYKPSKYILPDGKEIDVYNLSRFYSTVGQKMHGRDANYLKFEDLFTNFNPLTLAGNGLGLWVADSYLPTDTDWEKPFEAELRDGDKFIRLIKRVPSIPGRDIKAEVVVVGSGADKKVKALSIELVDA